MSNIPMSQEHAKTHAWDFSPVFDLLKSLDPVIIPQDDTEQSPNGVHGSNKSTQPKAGDSTSPRLESNNAKTSAGHVPSGLGDFNKLWDALNIQHDSAKTSVPVFERSLSGPRQQTADAYASDGALYYPPSAQSKSVRWRDEAGDPEYGLTETQADSPSDAEDEQRRKNMTKTQRKRENRKERARELELHKMAETLIQKRKVRTSNANAKESDQSGDEAARPVSSSAKGKGKAKENVAPQKELAANSSADETTTLASSAKSNKKPSTPSKLPKTPTKAQATPQGQAKAGATKAEIANKTISNTKAISIPSAKPNTSSPGVANPNLRPSNVQPTTPKTKSIDIPGAKAKTTQASRSTPVGSDTIVDQVQRTAATLTPSAQHQRAMSDARDFNGIHPPRQTADLSHIPTIQETPSRRQYRHEIRPREVLEPNQRNWSLFSKLIRNFPADHSTLLSPMQLSYNKPRPEGIHVFVDSSNILIGFQKHLKAARGIPEDERVPRVYPSFHALALLLERRRPVAKRVLAGSTPDIPAYEQAREIGYETCILDKVWKARQLTERQKRFARRETGGYTSGSGSDSAANILSSSPSNIFRAQPKWVEQAVDEILHLKILESIVDTPAHSESADANASDTQDSSSSKPRPTMVLATGDAAEAEYSSGFLRMVQRALNNGWHVEVVAWSASVSAEYRRLERRQNRANNRAAVQTQDSNHSGGAGGSFKIVELDEYAEELFPPEI